MQESLSPRICEEYVFDFNKTHFKPNKNDDKKLEVRQNGNINYSDVLIGNDIMTLVLLLRGSSREEAVTFFRIFWENNTSGSIEGSHKLSLLTLTSAKLEIWLIKHILRISYPSREILRTFWKTEVENIHGWSCWTYNYWLKHPALLRSWTEHWMLQKHVPALRETAHMFIIQIFQKIWELVEWSRIEVSV